MDQAEKDFIEFLFDRHCIKVGKRNEFKLKSLRLSNYFYDAQESFDSETLRIVGKAYASKIVQKYPPGSFDLFLGPAEKGTAIALATAMSLPEEYGRIPVYWDRKVPKDYGSENKRPSWIVGAYDTLKDMVRTKDVIRPLVPDDVITTGKAKKETMERFVSEAMMLKHELSVERPVERPFDVKFIEILISLHRRETDEIGNDPIQAFESVLGTSVRWVTDAYKVMGHLAEIGAIEKENVADFVAYQEQYGLKEDKERLEELESLL